MLARLVTATAVGLVLVASATAASAQTRIAVGERSGATLNAQSPKLNDGSYYGCWVVEPGSGPITIDMMTSFFDAFLVVGTGTDCGESMVPLAADDDSGNNTNAQISGTFTEPRLLIRANAFNAGEEGNYWIEVKAGLPEVEERLGSMDALPEVVSEWSTDGYVCAGAYRAMGDLARNVGRYGNVGTIDYAARDRQVTGQMAANERAAIDFTSSNFVLIALGGFIDDKPQQVSEYLTTLANCDRANGFTPVTRFR
ncbi:hypothetical protein [Brevundimonas sp.]|uniref:hypothetical protein n=1 Tax=Brevundimonas sp. TaxID=1871086 RepID=UPI003AF6EE32